MELILLIIILYPAVILVVPFIIWAFSTTVWEFFTMVSKFAAIVWIITSVVCLFLSLIKRNRQYLLAVFIMSVITLPGLGYRQYLIYRENTGEVKVYVETADDEINQNSSYLYVPVTIYEGSVVCVYQDYSSGCKWRACLKYYYEEDGTSVSDTFHYKKKYKTVEEIINTLELSEQYISLTYKEFNDTYGGSLSFYVKSNADQIADLY